MSAAVRMYRIDSIDMTGKKLSQRFEGRSAEEAKKISGIPDSRIVRVVPDVLGSMVSDMEKAKPSLEVQAQILAIFSAQAASGASTTQSFDRICGGYKIFKKQMPNVAQISKVSEKMKYLNFDPSLQLLAEVGEKSGTLAEVMSGAADDMIERQKLIGGIVRQAVPSLITALVGILALMLVPVFVVDPLNQVHNSRGIKFKDNFCTDFLMFDGTYLPKYWWLPIAVVVFVIVTRPKWWPAVKRLPFFSAIDNFFSIINSYLFISSFLPLFKRGVPLLESIETLERFSKGAARKAFEKMKNHVRTGGEVSTAFEDDHWHPVLRDCMRGFDQMRDEQKSELLNRVKPLMTGQMARTGGTLTGVLSTFGLVVSLTVVVTVFVGLMLPLMTISTPLKS